MKSLSDLWSRRQPVANAHRVAELSARVIFSGVLLLLPLAAQQPHIQYAESFPGLDIGVKINAAYAALPTGGGQIVVSKSAGFSTPISFTTPNKPVLLTGLPGDIITLTYAGAGTAILFDYTMDHRMGH